MSAKAKWTFMVYLAGDNNLSSAGDKDLTEMRSVGSTEAVNILAEFDNEGQQGTNRYYIRKDGAGERREPLGETDSGDPNTLTSYIKWAAENYPAERYALILWNHGGGWEPSEIDRVARSVNSGGYNVREASERSSSPLGRTFFRTSIETIFSLPSSSERAICSDDGSGHSLDTVELGAVLAQAVEDLGQPIDILGMDACLMSNLEVAYQARPHARYMVASEESEPNDGWPYDTILGKLVSEPDLPTAELAAEIVSAYMKSYLDRGYKDPVTQSAFDLARVGPVAESLDGLAGALSAHMPAAAMEIWAAQRASPRFWHNTLWDVTSFCEELENNSASEQVRQAAAAVRAILKPGSEGFIIAEAHSGDKVARCGGLTIYLVPPLIDISRYYQEVDFAKEFKWLEMLQAYHSA
jgi:hypothetical protein